MVPDEVAVRWLRKMANSIEKGKRVCHDISHELELDPEAPIRAEDGTLYAGQRVTGETWTVRIEYVREHEHYHVNDAIDPHTQERDQDNG